MTLSEVGGYGKGKTYCEYGPCNWHDWKFRDRAKSERVFTRHLRWRHGLSLAQYDSYQIGRFQKMSDEFYRRHGGAS